MQNIYVRAGQTAVSVTLRIIDATDGTPETGVVFNTAGIDMEYRRELAASVDITEVTLGALSTAWTEGGFLHIGNGYYRLDVPDAAFASGSSGVLIHGTVTGMVVIGCYVQLTAENAADVATAVLAGVVEGTTTVKDSLRLKNAVDGGKTNGLTLGVGTMNIRDLADTKNRVVATVDSNGNRTAMTLDLT